MNAVVVRQRSDVIVFGPRNPCGLETLDHVWLLASEVDEFRAINLNVVQFPRLVSQRNQFPASIADCTIPFMLEEQSASWQRLSSQ